MRLNNHALPWRMCSIHQTDGDATINRAKGGIGENSFGLFSSSLRSDRRVRAAPNRLPPICRTVGRSPHARSANKKGAPGPLFIGGQGGIRTHGRLAPTPHFECGAFNHSTTCPPAVIVERAKYGKLF